MKEYEVKDGDFFVLMVTKAKTVSKAPVKEVSKEEKKAVAKEEPPAQKKAENVPAKSSTPSESVPAVIPGIGNPSSLVSGSEYEQTVNNLVEMGFERPQIVQAMKAAFNNPDRAVEYLMNGIPDSVVGQINAVPPAAGDSTGQNVAQAGEDFDQFQSQLSQLRELIRHQPHLLEPMLQQLGQSNPEMMQLIGSNPGAFMDFLTAQEGAEFESGENMTESAEGAETAPSENVIALGPSDVEAIQRLCALGFDRNQALEAYIACDKNEELAANYLFDSM
jgi:UV excision repair protein RAD23